MKHIDILKIMFNQWFLDQGIDISGLSDEQIEEMSKVLDKMSDKNLKG